MNSGVDTFSPLKADPKTIQLHRVESSIKDLKYLKYPLMVAVIYFFIRLIYDFFHVNNWVFSVDIAIEIITVIAYGYGLQAFNSRNYSQWSIFFIWTLFYFLIIGFYLFNAITTKAWGWVAWHVFGIAFNIFLVIISNRYRTNLKKRDQLKKELKEEGKGESRDSSVAAP